MHLPAATEAARVTSHATGAETTLTVRRGVPYRETPQRRLTLDYYRADWRKRDGGAENDARDQRPAVMLIHGGGWREGRAGQLSRYALDLAAAGFVAVEANYRLSGEATFPAALTDVKAAVRWLRANAAGCGVDPGRVAVAGHSAGAHLAALASVTADERFEPNGAGVPNTPSRVDAVVGASGVYDFERATDDEMVAQFLGGTAEERPDRYREASPVTYAGAAPPTLLLHGTADGVVPPAQSGRYRDALAAAGVETNLFRAAGGDHVFLHGSGWYDRVRKRIEGFLRANL